jgi:hypothetical protein
MREDTIMTRCFTAFLLVATTAALGCPKSESDTAGSSGGGSGQPGLGAHVVRGKEKRSLENDIRQLAQLMETYQTEFGNPPKNWAEFKSYIQRDAAHIVREIDAKQIEVIWGAPMNSATIIAYEVQPDLRGNHVVAKGDASVVTMPTAELKAALQRR